MAYNKDEIHELLERVEKHVKTSPEFTQSDWDNLHAMAKRESKIAVILGFGVGVFKILAAVLPVATGVYLLWDKLFG